MTYFLLDTGILLGLTRKAPWARQAFERFNLNDRETATVTSVICQGEILALAEKNGWGEKKRAGLEQILNALAMANQEASKNLSFDFQMRTQEMRTCELRGD